MSDSIGGYRLVRSLASGGTAEVFLAIGPDGQRVALKLLHGSFVDETEFLRAFHAEALLVMGLVHPAIARALSVSRDGERHFIVMEYVDGPTLGAMLKRGPVPQPIAVAILDAVLRALDYAHKTFSVVHRDLTPFNVLIDRSGTVKVTDFGTAKAALNPTRTRTGVLKGQFAYMSPEHARGKAVDARSDVFSVGLLAHELITGGRVYDAPEEGAVLGLARDARVPPLAGPLAAVVARACAREPADRFASCAEFAAALATFAKAPQREVAAWVEPKQKTKRLHLLYAVPAIGLAGYLLWPPAAPPVAVVPRQAASLPTPTPASMAVAPAREPMGYLTVNTQPWSKVSVDGRSAVPTPLTRVSLTVGKHHVTFVRPTGERHIVEVFIKENALTTHFYKW